MLGVCLISLFAVNALIAAVLYPIGSVPEYLESSFGLLWEYRLMVPLGMFAIGAYQIMVSYATHKQTFKIISQTKIYQGYGGPISQIILGLANTNVWGMIIGFVIGQSMGAGMLVKKLIPRPKQVLKSMSMSGIKAMAYRFRDFPLISSFSSMINMLGGNNILFLAIPMIYNSTVITGFIFLINRIVERPLLMVSTSILQVYMGDAYKTQSHDRVAMRSRFLNVLKFQFIIVSGWLFLINASAYYLIPFVFGEDWRDSVQYIYILSIAYLPQMTMHAVTHTLQILEKQKLAVIYDTIRLLIVIFVLFLGYAYTWQVSNLLIAYGLVQALASGILFMLMYKSINEVNPA
jgi:O-antigen/teichoic acid export membrane protein